MKQKILLIIALFAIVVGARAQTLYKSNVVVEKNELLESNVTVWKRWANWEWKDLMKKEQLDARLQEFAQRPTEIKDIEIYEKEGYLEPDENGNYVRKPYYFLVYYQREDGNVRNSFRGEFDLYKNPDGTPHHAVMKSLEEGTMSAGDVAIHWIINEVEYEGLTYPVTEIGNRVGFYDRIYTVHCYDVVGFTMLNLTTIGEDSFYTHAAGTKMFQNLQTLNLPNLKTVGRSVFNSNLVEFNGESFTSLKVLNLPNLETVGSYSFSGKFCHLESIYVPKLKEGGVNIFQSNCVDFKASPHINVYLPIDVWLDEGGGGCFWRHKGGTTFHILDNGGKIKKLTTDDGTVSNGDPKRRFLVPQGKAQAIAELWGVRILTYKNEVYSPVSVSKANDGYGTMVIEPGDACASYTQDGVTYVNHYDFNRALSAADVKKPFDAPFNDIEVNYRPYNAPEDYRHKWFVATNYMDNYNNKQEGTLTITSPLPYLGDSCYGVRPGDGFLLQGPAFSGTGDGVMWVPVAISFEHSGSSIMPAKPNSYTKKTKKPASKAPDTYEHYAVVIPYPYTGTNYFKAGTGAAVPRESDGCRNFYYTSPTGFWECRNTVIPTNRAYLALPSEMTANAKQISFVIDDGEGEVTGVVNVNPDRYTMSEEGELVPCQGDGAWYTLEGFRLQGKPTTKGIYLHNGRKEVIK